MDRRTNSAASWCESLCQDTLCKMVKEKGIIPILHWLDIFGTMIWAHLFTPPCLPHCWLVVPGCVCPLEPHQSAALFSHCGSQGFVYPATLNPNPSFFVPLFSSPWSPVRHLGDCKDTPEVPRCCYDGTHMTPCTLCALEALGSFTERKQTSRNLLHQVLWSFAWTLLSNLHV